ncbi:MAG: hypothetical protein E6767_00855 [Dysgonomonas sp.]|nr:hypothetical protein [Dysgonomonas sp.]
MRISIIIISLFVSILSVAQNDLDIEFQEYISDYQNFDIKKLSKKEFEHSLARFSIQNLPSYRRDTSFLIVNRKLDFDVHESIYRVVLNYVAADSSLRQNNYRLHVLKLEDQIIGIICNSNYPKKIDTYFDEDKINWYIKQHDLFYQVITDIDVLISDLLQNKVYGYKCGIVPIEKEVPEQYGYKLNEVKNIPVFREWIRSYNPELQTYGVDALSTIYNKAGSEIVQQQKRAVEYDLKLIDYVKKRNSIINTCSGSIHGIYKSVF